MKKQQKFVAEPIDANGCWAVKRFNELKQQYELFPLKHGQCLSELEALNKAAHMNALSKE